MDTISQRDRSYLALPTARLRQSGGHQPLYLSFSHPACLLALFAARLVATSTLRYKSFEVSCGNEQSTPVRQRKAGTHARPFVGVFKSQLTTYLSILTIIFRQMAPRTRKRLQERGRDIPTKGLLWGAANSTSRVVTYRGTSSIRNRLSVESYSRAIGS